MASEAETEPSGVLLIVAKRERTRFVVWWPLGQTAGSSLRFMGRSTSNCVAQGGQ